MKEIVFWGATGQSKVLHEALISTEYELVAIVDNRSFPRSPIENVPLLKGREGLEIWLSNHYCSESLAGAAAIGGSKGKDRVEILDYFMSKGLLTPALVHRCAFVASDAKIDNGCQILAQAAVCTHAILGAGTIVNTSASVDHDCVLGKGVHVAPGARLAGEVTIGDYAFLGTGSIVLPGISIGIGAVIGAGAVVTKNVQPGETVVGCPARPLREADHNEQS